MMFTLIFVGLFASASTMFNWSCDNVPLNNRIECGWEGITQSICEARWGSTTENCCWDNSVSTVNWCFCPSSVCAVWPRSRRIDCGWPGITAEECTTRNCCWDDTVEGFNFCFCPRFYD